MKNIIRNKNLMYTLWSRLDTDEERTREQGDRSEDIIHNAVQRDKEMENMKERCKDMVNRMRVFISYV